MNVDKLGLKEVINASGKMTILGVSTVSDKVLEAQTFGGQHFFEMEDLSRKSGQYLAELIGVEDAHIVASASAGIAQCVAAVIGKGDLFDPFKAYARREIIIPKGHNVDYGAPVEVMIGLGGGQVVEAGYANMCTGEHLAAKVSEQTAAILYVKSHHCVQKSMLSVSEAAEVAKQFGIPLIVDAAAEEDLLAYVQAGADLVIYSGGKALSGPSSGLVIGKHPYVDWIRLQGKGIGRAMKIGKDNILGLVAAVEEYVAMGTESGASMKERLVPFIQALNEIPGIKADVVQDGAGRDIFRARVQVLASLAKKVVELQKVKSPAIYTREYQVNHGVIEYDVRMVTKEQMEKIVTRLKEIMTNEIDTEIFER